MSVKYAPRTQTAAVARAKSLVGTPYPKGWCQAWVVAQVFGTGGVGDFDGDRAADAEDGWKEAVKNGRVVKASQIKNLNDIPAGYAIYWGGGSRDNGHAAVTAGNGQIYTTDLNGSSARYGKIGKASITAPHTVWGLTLLGYATEMNGYILTDKDDDMPSAEDFWKADVIPAPDDKNPANPTWQARSALGVILRNSVAMMEMLDADSLADKIVAKLPAGGGGSVSKETVKQAVREVLTEGVDAGKA